MKPKTVDDFTTHFRGMLEEATKTFNAEDEMCIVLYMDSETVRCDKKEMTDFTNEELYPLLCKHTGVTDYTTDYFLNKVLTLYRLTRNILEG